MTSITSLFPRAASELTTDWLIEILTASGAIAPGTRVTDLRAQRIAEGVGFASFLYRVHLVLDGAGPASVIAKFPTDYPDYQLLAASIRLYEREVTFYNEVTTSAPLRSPRAHAAEFDSATGEFVIVMEDVGALENADQVVGLSFDRARAVLAETARFHAWGWDTTPQATRHPAFLNLDDARMAGLFSAGTAAGWAVFARHGRADVPADLATLIDDYTTSAPHLLSALTTPTTLVNGDLRADNLFFADDGSHVTVDFQFAGRGCGIWDVAYLVGQGMSPAERDGREIELVRHYLSTLAGLGIDYPFDQAWQQFQIATVIQIALPLAAMMSWDNVNDRGRELLQVLMERSVAIIADCDAVSAVRAVIG
ncbi:MAG: phosphotransferase [Mycolicibacterium neoaurum]|uniref:phosphotransferase n=1 Tax=Mycolicibacterium neoaurum TaxID=1795 RepID=UPI002FF64407